MFLLQRGKVANYQLDNKFSDKKIGPSHLPIIFANIPSYTEKKGGVTG